jgi:hypothetical protein
MFITLFFNKLSFGKKPLTQQFSWTFYFCCLLLTEGDFGQQIDPSKIQMDVVKPWIATRVTELIGFEDEVLINFIYGLLEGKVIRL